LVYNFPTPFACWPSPLSFRFFRGTTPACDPSSNSAAVPVSFFGRPAAQGFRFSTPPMLFVADVRFWAAPGDSFAGVGVLRPLSLSAPPMLASGAFVSAFDFFVFRFTLPAAALFFLKFSLPRFHRVKEGKQGAAVLRRIVPPPPFSPFFQSPPPPSPLLVSARVESGIWEYSGVTVRTLLLVASWFVSFPPTMPKSH